MNMPTVDDQAAANLRAVALKAMAHRFGAERAAWPADVQADALRLEAQQEAYEAEFADFLGGVVAS